ncbi:MAG: enoyl-CoA hydratase-related protein [Actinomycetota bacterium]|nr:enoyl-CoA hydratase-related protein [Actinomycetota bacterium]
MPVDYVLEDHVAWVTLNRPERRNAIDAGMQEELASIWAEVEASSDVRVVVLTGAGEQAFCAGDDLRSGDGKTGTAYWLDLRPDGFGHLTLRQTLSVPVLARVNGFALGGGLEMVIGCDLAVAAETAEFGFVEPRLGRLPLDGGIVGLIRQLPAKWAMEVLLTGRRFTAEEAARLALVNEVVPAGQLDAAIERWLEWLLACAPLSLRAIKAIVKTTEGMSARNARLQQVPELIACLESNDGREGVQAFREKRAPKWSAS